MIWWIIGGVVAYAVIGLYCALSEDSRGMNEDTDAGLTFYFWPLFLGAGLVELTGRAILYSRRRREARREILLKEVSTDTKKLI